MDINQLGLIPMGDDVRAAKAAYEGAIFARANVVGVAIGNKVIRGSETDERCIVVFVEAKKPEAQLRHWDVVPKTFGNVRTDIVETGRFHALRSEQAIDLERTKRTRPAPGGVSIGHVQITAGTLGVLARRKRAAGHPVEQPRPREPERRPGRGPDPATWTRGRWPLAGHDRTARRFRADPVQGTRARTGRSVPGAAVPGPPPRRGLGPPAPPERSFEPR